MRTRTAAALGNCRIFFSKWENNKERRRGWGGGERKAENFKKTPRDSRAPIWVESVETPDPPHRARIQPRTAHVPFRYRMIREMSLCHRGVRKENSE